MHFTCRPRWALKDRKEENQAVRGLEVEANSAENGLFLASVTMPAGERAPSCKAQVFQLLGGVWERLGYCRNVNPRTRQVRF
jgi:hypothetical protein